MHTKHLSVVVQKADDPAFDARFIMSAATLDRVRDTIDPKAYDAAIAKVGDKLIALFNHNSDAPIGYWQKLKRVGDTLTGYIKFASVPIAQMVKTLIDEGVPMGASIGFRGKGNWVEEQNGMHFTAIELFETSIVSTPAHPRAMQIAKQLGIILPAEPTHTSSQRVALARAKMAVKGILSAEPGTPADMLSAYDALVAEGRAYLVANQATIDPMINMEFAFSKDAFEVVFERSTG